MKEAIARVSKTLQGYTSRTLPRSLATIELVSAFKVISKTTIDPDYLTSIVSAYIEGILTKIDTGMMTSAEALTDLTQVYQSAHDQDPNLAALMTATDKAL